MRYMVVVTTLAALLFTPFASSALAEDLSDPKALLERGDGYKSAGDADKALADYKKAVEIAPGTDDAVNARHKTGIIYYEQNKYDEAIAEFNEVLRTSPNAANAYYMRGVSYIDSARPAEGIPDMDKFITLNPDLASAYGARGMGYLLLGQFDKAITDFDSSIKLEPSDPSVYMKRATAYHDKAKAGSGTPDYRKSIDDYTKCTEINPDYRRDYVYRWRADSYAAVGDQIAAIADYDRAIQIAPNAAELYCDRGNANFRAKRYNNAKEDYVKAVQLDPKGRTGKLAYDNIQVLVKMLKEKSQGPEGLTQEEVDRVTAMEQDWGMNIDKAVPFIRQRNYPAARVYVDKARATVEEMKKILSRKSHDVTKIDRLVGMEKLVDVYENINKLGAYANEPQAAIKDIGKVREIFADTRERLKEAYAAFHEVPPLQGVCNEIWAILDALENEIRKY